MITLKSRNSDLSVVFSNEMVQEDLELRGWQVTNSISEHQKAYYTRSVIKPRDLNVLKMNRVNYMNLLELISIDGNNFDIISTDGEMFNNCYIDGSLTTLNKMKDKITKEIYYSGSLKINVR